MDNRTEGSEEPYMWTASPQRRLYPKMVNLIKLTEDQ